MRLRLVVVGERPRDWVQAGYQDYAKRLPRGWSLSVSEIPAARRSGRAADPQRSRDDEAARLLTALAARRGQGIAVALDGNGEPWSSEQLAARLRGWQSEPEIAFVVGGPDGLGQAVLARCDARWSLSALTFPHALVRVLLAEQIYRAWSILNHHPYHRA